MQLCFFLSLIFSEKSMAFLIVMPEKMKTATITTTTTKTFATGSLGISLPFMSWTDKFQLYSVVLVIQCSCEHY